MSTDRCCGTEKMCALTCCPCAVDVEALKPLVNQPRFICEACGRVANEEKNLCKPVKMES